MRVIYILPVSWFCHRWIRNSKNRVEAWLARPESAVVRRIGTSPARKPNVENDDSLSQHEPYSLAFGACVRHPVALTVTQGGLPCSVRNTRGKALPGSGILLAVGWLPWRDAKLYVCEVQYFAKRYRLVCGKEATGFAGRPGQGDVLPRGVSLPRRSSRITCSGSLEALFHT